jgi:hypothetical protein
MISKIKIEAEVRQIKERKKNRTKFQHNAREGITTRVVGC